LTLIIGMQNLDSAGSKCEAHDQPAGDRIRQHDVSRGCLADPNLKYSTAVPPVSQHQHSGNSFPNANGNRSGDPLSLNQHSSRATKVASAATPGTRVFGGSAQSMAPGGVTGGPLLHAGCACLVRLLVDCPPQPAAELDQGSSIRQSKRNLASLLVDCGVRISLA
jgi:hypothetical protein